MKSRGAIAGAILGASAAVLLAAAVWETYQRYRAVLLWKSVEATVVESGLEFRHDGDGRLRFFVRAVLQYATPSHQQKTTADSDFSSLSFAAARSRLDKVEPGTKIKAYYDPVQADKVRFGSEFSLEYLGRAAYYYAGAALAAFAAAAIPLLWKPGRICTACKTKLKRRYRYCTFCGAPAGGSPHPIRNERTVET
jgi:hypothetical protein